MSQQHSSVLKLNGEKNIFPHSGYVTRDMRHQRYGHCSGVVWLTGLSGAGKSTIATHAEQQLFAQGYLITVLDGDTLRTRLNADLNFDPESRRENLRRAGEVAALFAHTGHIVLATFVSPFQEGRQYVREIVNDNFHLVHVRAELDDCIERDPKGLYKKALDGGIENFTGIGQGYEEPDDAELIINTSDTPVERCTEELVRYIRNTFSA